jgi:hypothetical protein
VSGNKHTPRRRSNCQGACGVGDSQLPLEKSWQAGTDECTHALRCQTLVHCGLMTPEPVAAPRAPEALAPTDAPHDLRASTQPSSQCSWRFPAGACRTCIAEAAGTAVSEMLPTGGDNIHIQGMRVHRLHPHPLYPARPPGKNASSGAQAVGEPPRWEIVAFGARHG